MATLSPGAFSLCLVPFAHTQLRASYAVAMEPSGVGADAPLTVPAGWATPLQVNVTLCG